ncbi:MAG: DUF1801 domain-containing protein [Saprospiraceae bacterium]|nr:DUF1801 domain-containing protein [Saprospiraceae bacterium]
MSASKNKTVPTKNNVQSFLDKIENEEKRAFANRIQLMLAEVSGEQAVMWGTSIVGYGQYHYKYASGREGDFMKVGFSPRKQNMTLYIMPGFHRYNELLSKLGKYKTGKSCLYIKKEQDINFDVLKELVASSYDFMTNKYG